MDEAWKGFVPEIDIEDGAVMQIRLHPIRLLDENGGRGDDQWHRILPSLVHGEQAVDAIRHVIEDSEALGTRFTPAGDAWEIRLR